MNLAFKTYINGKPNYFTEKIIDSLDIPNTHLLQDYYTRFPNVIRYTGTDLKPKHHTIRSDYNNRWRPGRDIHFFINDRKPNMFRFAPIIKCVSVQKIEINYSDFCGRRSVAVDGRIIYITNARGHSVIPEELKTLALNDGFDSIEAFFEWFSSDFKGNIIHWTDLKY